MSKDSDRDSPSSQYDRSHRFWWFIVGLLTVLVFLATLKFTENPIPGKVVLATGGAGGGYDKFGQALRDLVEADSGLEVELRPSSGSLENFELLCSADKEDRADLAFVQSGIPEAMRDLENADRVTAAAALYSEPLWVFYRSRGRSRS